MSGLFGTGDEEEDRFFCAMGRVLAVWNRVEASLLRVHMRSCGSQTEAMNAKLTWSKRNSLERIKRADGSVQTVTRGFGPAHEEWEEIKTRVLSLGIVRACVVKGDVRGGVRREGSGTSRVLVLTPLGAPQRVTEADDGSVGDDALTRDQLERNAHAMLALVRRIGRFERDRLPAPPPAADGA